jgi:hypothetical protein
MLPRRPGEKESRYSHLLSGDQPSAAGMSEQAPAAEPHASPDRIERLETEVIELRATLNGISARLASLEAAAPQHDS